MQTLSMAGDVAELRCAYDDKHRAKLIPGYTFNAKTKCWNYPVTARLVDDVKKQFPMVQVAPTLALRVGRLKQSADMLAAMKDAGWQNAVAVQPMPITVKPFQHQVAAYNVGMVLFGW